MSREKPNIRAQRAGVEGVLRHPDGSVDIAAYARIAHRERAAAMASWREQAIGMVREMLSVIRARLAPVVKSDAGFRKASRRCRQVGVRAISTCGKRARSPGVVHARA